MLYIKAKTSLFLAILFSLCAFVAVVAGHLPLFFVFGFLAILTAVVQIQYDWEYIAWKSEFK